MPRKFPNKLKNPSNWKIIVTNHLTENQMYVLHVNTSVHSKNAAIMTIQEYFNFFHQHFFHGLVFHDQVL